MFYDEACIKKHYFQYISFVNVNNINLDWSPGMTNVFIYNRNELDNVIKDYFVLTAGVILNQSWRKLSLINNHSN